MPTPFDSFEAVDKYVNAHAAAAQGIKPPAKAIAPANWPAELKQICDIWVIARPILVFIVKFLPSNWKIVVQGLIDFLDAICPNAKNA